MEARQFSTPVSLGTSRVGGDGSDTGMITIRDGAPSGARRVVTVAKTSDGKPASSTVGINVDERESGLDVADWLKAFRVGTEIA